MFFIEKSVFGFLCGGIVVRDDRGRGGGDRRDIRFFREFRRGVGM